MSSVSETLRRVAEQLSPHEDEIVAAWSAAVEAHAPEGDGVFEPRAFCTRYLTRLLERLGSGDVEEYLAEEAVEAARAARAEDSLLPIARAVRFLGHSCGTFLSQARWEPAELGEGLVALEELAHRLQETLLRAQEEESTRRLIEAQNQAARAEEKARELGQANQALREAEAQSEHRADQIALVANVVHRIAGVLEPEELLQETASAIQTRTDFRYVAVVVLDDEGVLMGRWAGRANVGRESVGRAQGPPKGIIGRALRKRAPQVVADVTRDPDYHADVGGTRSEMVLPLLDEGRAIGVLDFQSDEAGAFSLDAVAAGEALCEYVVVALRNARLVAQLRQRAAGEPPG